MIEHPRYAEPGVPLADHEQGRYIDHDAGERRLQLPVAIQVAVVVQATAKTGASESRRIGVEVGSGQPVRHLLRIGKGCEQPVAPRDHSERIWRLVSGLPRAGLSRSGEEDFPQRLSNVPLQFCLGDAGFLEVEYVELCLIGLREDAGWRHGWLGHHRNADRDHAAEAVGPHLRRLPRDRRAPVVADDEGGLCAEGVQERDHIPDKVKQGVFVDRRGAFRMPISAHVRRHRTKSGLGQRRDLMTPGVGRFRKAVAEEDKWPFSLFDDIHPDRSRLDGASRHFRSFRS